MVERVYHADILTLFPDMFPGPLGYSLCGRGLRAGIWQFDTHNLRDWSCDRHGRVDGPPAGGGSGMVLRADVLGRALDDICGDDDHRPRLLMSARGRPLDHSYIRELSSLSGVIVVCGRFEGVDERVISGRNLIEVSIGDFILSGGEIAAYALLDAIIRLLPGIMGNVLSGDEESFVDHLLEYPHYTKPREWEGRVIPDILLSGDHKAIYRWRRAQSEFLTKACRPDLWRRRKK